MRKPRKEGETFQEWPMYQKIGQMGHRVLGFTWLIMALISIEMGTHMTNVGFVDDLANQDEKYMAGFIAVLFATGLLGMIMWFDKIRFARVTPTTDAAVPVGDSTHV